MKGTCIQKVKTRRVGAALSRSKTGRGIGRKRVRLPSTSLTLPSNRTDEDSGLGGDSLDTTSAEAGKSIELSSYFLASTAPSPALTFQSFENKSKHKSSWCEEESKPKRLRLDMTEEASDVPDQKSNWFQTAKQKILSFKNVPDLNPMLSPNCVLTPQTKFPSSVQSGTQPQASHPKPQQVVQPVVLKVRDKIQKRKSKTTSGFGPDYSDSTETSLPSTSSDGAVSLQLLSQPESQHRARYQTEGSRGAVKDRSGHGHPIVKLNGYNECSVLQVFVASDDESVNPHIYYQACKVSGKNSTPCKETKIDGTTILKIDLLPEKDMTISCDCVGILKVRNVDVEKRVKTSVSGSHKKSHKCRLVFRTTVTLKSGKQEVLQVASQPISCTQPPGLPEIGRKSLSKSSVKGGEDLFIIGKNFSKDTEVLFQSLSSRKNSPQWSKKVLPDKEYLQGTHLICKIPPYRDTSITESVEVQIVVISNGKKSDSQSFTYQPIALKNELRDSVQLQSLPKGVSPSAVEFNRLYTNSGDLLLPKYSSANRNIAPAKLPSDQVREKAVVHPMIFSCNVCGSGAPSISTKTYTKLDLNSGTSTTATHSAPKFNNATFIGNSNNLAPSVNLPEAPGSYLPIRKTISVPPNPISVNQQPFIFAEPKANKAPILNDDEKKMEVKKRVTLENLCRMLKLANTLPVNLQSSFLELLSNEIISRIKDDSTENSKSNCQSTTPVSFVNDQTSMLAESRTPPTQLNIYEKDIDSFKSQPNVLMNDNTNCFTNQPNTNSSQSQFILPYAIIAPQRSNKISTLKQQEAQYINLSIWQPTTKVSRQNLPQERRRQVMTQSGCPTNSRQFDEISVAHNRPMSNQNCFAFGSGMNHPMASRQINNKAISTESKQTNFNDAPIPNDLKLEPTYIEEFQDVSVNFSLQEQQNMKVMHSLDTLFSSTTTAFDSQKVRMPDTEANSASTDHSIAQKALGESSQNQHNIKIVTGHQLQQEVIQSSQLHFQLTEGSQKQQTISLQNSNETMQGQENCFPNQMQNDILHETASVSLTNYQPLCLESNGHGNEVHMGSINSSFDPSTVMQIENCDPLLSQASGTSSLNIPQSRNNIGPQNLNPISSSVSSDVTTAISQLSESELINYINTNCFDNV